MGPYVFTNPVVRQMLTDWFRESGELFVEIYLPHSSAGGDFYALTNYEQYQDLMEKARPGTISFVIREKQLPTRGIVTDGFIARAVELISNGEYYIVSEPCVYPKRLSCLGNGNTHNELKADLEQLRGDEVWVGYDFEMPQEYWKEDTSTNAIIATKPR